MTRDYGRPQKSAAHGFHQSLPNGRGSGELVLNSTHVSFNNEHGSVTLPLSGIQIKMGGANDRLVFFSHPKFPEWSIYTADRNILKSPFLKAKTELLTQIKKAKRTRILGWSSLVLIATIVIMLPVFIIFSMDTITAAIAPSIPIEYEESIGESAWAQVKLDSQILDMPEVIEPFNRLISPLLAVAESERYVFKVHIVKSDELNAFALPGGIIAINSGLILAAQSGEEILGVLAHEIAHVTEQHGVRSVIGTAGIILTVQAMFGDVSGLLGLIVDAGPLLLRQSYSRAFESQADERGFDLLVDANINPQGMVTFFNRIIDERDEKLDQIEDQDTRDLIELTSGLLSTHPETEVRVIDIEKRLEKIDMIFRPLNPSFLELKEAINMQITKDNNEEVSDEK